MVCTWQLFGNSSDKRKARDDDDVIAIPVALPLHFQISSILIRELNFFRCVVGTVLMLYHHAIERTVLAALTFIRCR